jgi:hypothetical protein
MPNGWTPAGSVVGDEASSVRLPPSTAKALTFPAPVSTTQSLSPLGPRRASSGPRPVGELNDVLPSNVSVPSAAIEKREMLGTAVLTVNRKFPSCVISTQQGAVCLSAKGEPAIGSRIPFAVTSYAEMLPLPAPSWAFETKSWSELVGRNSLPNGPAPWAARENLVRLSGSRRRRR